MERISIFNYEAFYLDLLEGNLSEKDTVLLFEFLDKHPELKLEDETLMTLNDEPPKLDEQFKSGLKQIEFNSTTITPDNEEQFMIAETEGLLSETKLKELDQYVGADRDRNKMRRTYAVIKLKPDVRVVFSDKDSLKRSRRIALWPVISFAAAACAAVLFLLWDPADSALTVQANQSVAHQDQKDQQQNSEQNDDSAVSDETSSQPVQVAVVGMQEAAGDTPATAAAVADHPQRIDHLSLKKADILPEKNSDLEIVPTTWSKPQHVQQDASKNDYTVLGFDDMNNPIKPITNRLSDVVKQEVDFRTAKPTEKRSGGFYVKIGKFELSHRKSL
jgi:hypothetical protein